MVQGWGGDLARQRPLSCCQGEGVVALGFNNRKEWASSEGPEGSGKSRDSVAPS